MGGVHVWRMYCVEYVLLYFILVRGSICRYSLTYVGMYAGQNARP